MLTHMHSTIMYVCGVPSLAANMIYVSLTMHLHGAII